MVKVRELIRLVAISIKYWFLVKVYKMDIAKTSRISFGAKLDKTNPRGIHVGEDSYVASGAVIFSHDFSRRLKADTWIGKRCFVGANAIIMPGVQVEDEVVVGAGAVVTRDVKSNSIVAGNPARVIRSGISAGPIWSNGRFGVMADP
jgi:acetyltransferase-like isoleucine patch superfamily enzyme